MLNVRPLVVALIVVPLAGCQVYVPRSIDSYRSTFRRNPPEPNRADPYTFGGIADGTGGLTTRTSYATDTKSHDPRSETETGKAAEFDQQRVQTPAAPGAYPPVATTPPAAGGATVPGTPRPTPPAGPGSPRPTMEPQKGVPLNAPPAR